MFGQVAAGRSWQLTPSTIAPFSIPLAMYIALLYLVRFGLDLTDESFYLYHLSHPTAETPFSGFVYLASPLGKLFGHHVIFYRVLALVATGVSTAYFSVNAVEFIRHRLNVSVPLEWAVSFALVLAAFHQALMATLSYNTVMTIGTLLIVGGLLRLLDGRPVTARIGNTIAVALGTACVVLARSVSGIALCVGILFVVFPVSYGISLLPRLRACLWFICAILAGGGIALASVSYYGVLDDLFETQTLMVTTGEGLKRYLLVYGKSFVALGKFLREHWLLLSTVIGLSEVIRRFSNDQLVHISIIPLAIFFAILAPFWVPVPRYVATILITSALFASIATMPRLAATAAAGATGHSPNRLITAIVVVSIILATPLLASVGTSTSIVPHTIYTLGPLGILLVLPIAAYQHDNRAVPSQFALRADKFAQALCYLILVGLALGVVSQRQWGAYRVKLPLLASSTYRLEAPDIVRGLYVAPEVGRHLEALAQIAKGSGLTPANARVLSLYGSPGSVLAMDLPALGPPWVFTHMPDAGFNCELVRRGFKGQWSTAVIVVNHDPRPEMLSCLEAFGLEPRGKWQQLGCAPPTTARGKLLGLAESCVYTAHKLSSRP